MIIQRTLEYKIKELNGMFPVILINGPRQVGKTTLFKSCMEKDRIYITLDNPEDRELAVNNPALFFQKYQGKLLIDEVQYAPQLLQYIKINVDKNDQENGMYWLTGSQQFHLMKHVSESLAGRIAILNLQGLSQSEKNKINNKEVFLPKQHYNKIENSVNLVSLYKTIWKGSFPKLYVNDVDVKMYYSSYLKTYIERDVRDLTRIVDESKFLTFIKILAGRTGQLLNYSDIANNVGINQATVKDWLSILGSAGLVYLLQPYSTNITSRMVKTPKLYFLDTGLVSYLTACETPEILENSIMSGPILETYVVSEILKSYWHKGEEAPIYFYRDSNSKEIDILIEKNNKIYPIEIKKTANPTKNDIKHFSVLEKINKEIGIGIVMCLIDQWSPLTESINAVNIGEV